MSEGKNNNIKPEQDINSLLRVRREKLRELQDSGRDPFQIMKYDVTHHSSDVKDNFDNLYQQYHALGKNGVMDSFHEEVMELPTTPEAH